MSEFPRLIVLVFVGTFLESTAKARGCLNHGAKSTAASLTPGGFGDSYVADVLTAFGYIVDTSTDAGDRNYDQSPSHHLRDSHRLFRYQTTEKLANEFPTAESLDNSLRDALMNDEGSELFKLCLLLDAWNLVAYCAELLEEMGIKTQLVWPPYRSRILDLAEETPPAKARYFLWQAQRKVAVNLVSKKLERESAEESLIDGALALLTKYSSSNKTTPSWKWYTKPGDSCVEVVLKRHLDPNLDLDLKSPAEIAFG